MNKELEQKIEEEALNFAKSQWGYKDSDFNREELINAKWKIGFSEGAYIAGTRSNTMLDYVIERAVELARKGEAGFTGNGNPVFAVENSLDEIKSIIKGEVR